MDSNVGIPVVDAHSHYFSTNTLRSWLQRGRTMESFTNRTKTRTDMTSIELPDEGMDVAQRWVDELDRHGVEAMGVMVGNDAYDEFLDARDRFPGRFLGYHNINPRDPDAAERVDRAAGDGFYGIKLYPSSWRDLRVYDEPCYPVYEAAKERGMLVFLHFGITIGGQADLRSGNPIDIQIPARDFPDVNFVIAHFGAGYFRETLMMQYQADNVYMDSSGSNSWMKYQSHPLDLKTIFRQALTAGGPEKTLFGTDSTFFPRGWRINVLEAQYRALKELSEEEDPLIDVEGIGKVFRGNILRLTGFKP
ncbi:amidohydrolase [Candidatus Bathyarchaeota archaeon]|nr:amidohydrolase [Candidatus Bathyarchaeota archaeon]MBL7168270.1 amidohydrolase [Candidatus Bathyarchaeota archaeon]